MKVLGSFVLMVVPALALAGQVEKTNPIGKTIDGFKLHDYRGAEKSLADFVGSKAVVVAFLGTECPLTRLYGARLEELARRYGPRGVAFVGINSNVQDSLTDIAAYAKYSGISFPILKDAGNGVADQFGARRTPEVFVLDQGRTVRYWGRVDDQFGIGFSRPHAQHHDLANALDELLAGKSVTQQVTEAPGCFIGRARKEQPKGEITYSQQVARILQKHCLECHRQGQIGPFPMTSYHEVEGWTETIKEVLQEGRMPPWHADPRYGEFSNDPRLTESEKQTLLQWIDNGAPEGDPKDLPGPVVYGEGWRIPKPDLVLSIPKPVHIPARGEVPYQFIVVDPGLKQDTWVRAAELKPTCRAVVHHVLAFIQPPGGGHDKYGGFAANWLVGMAPGTPPLILPEGTAKLIPAGSRFLLQIHYTVNGAPQVDQTEIGLVFADPKTVHKEVSTEMVAQPQFEIPPHDSNYRIEADATIPEDSMLLALMPHTHLRGKAFKFEAVYPDGKQEVLLDCPKYDFNWQNTYHLAKPKLLPKGTTIHGVAHYDNSTKNRSNPNPNATVKWGDQTWEEMMIGYFDLIPANQDLVAHPRAIGHYVPKKLPSLDPELEALAKHALESDKAFDSFAQAVHKALPDVDRVCLTTYANGALRVHRASYPGKVQKHLAMAGFEGHSKAMALGHFALLAEFFYMPDLSKMRAIDMTMLSKTLSSSAHVPFAIDGDPGTLNFWSAKKDAFPAASRDLMRAITEAVVAQKPSSTAMNTR
jgi:peroxiredoxin